MSFVGTYERGGKQTALSPVPPCSRKAEPKPSGAILSASDHNPDPVVRGPPVSRRREYQNTLYDESRAVEEFVERDDLRTMGMTTVELERSILLDKDGQALPAKPPRI